MKNNCREQIRIRSRIVVIYKHGFHSVQYFSGHYFANTQVNTHRCNTHESSVTLSLLLKTIDNISHILSSLGNQMLFFFFKDIIYKYPSYISDLKKLDILK